MKLARVLSRALEGASAPEVAVEVHLAGGLPAFNIVGLPDTGVKESRDRVRAALLTAGFEFPASRIVVSLAPADLPKVSGRFDLPIALGVLAASGQLPDADLGRYEFCGELSLGGDLRPVRGALAVSWHATRAGRAVMLPAENADEAALVRGARVYGARTLLEVCAHLAGQAALDMHAAPAPGPGVAYPDLADVRGQMAARTALEIAAAGGHSLLLVGPPGTGKSMLASRLAGILPPLDEEAAMESAALQSLSAQGFDPARWGCRVMRSPHHSVSMAALIGGGREPVPGEVTLAHHGVLFLDELPEFDRRALEALREPLEARCVEVARVARRMRFPARFQLVAAMNPCPCGYAGHVSGRCRCSPEQISRYRGKISGPLLDRIDMQVEMVSPLPGELFDARPAESSAVVRARVMQASARQLQRQGKSNAFLTMSELAQDCHVEPGCLEYLSGILNRLAMSVRAADRVLRVARTIADLAGAARIAEPHLLQAVQLRRHACAR